MVIDRIVGFCLFSGMVPCAPVVWVIIVVRLGYIWYNLDLLFRGEILDPHNPNGLPCGWSFLVFLLLQCFLYKLKRMISIVIIAIKTIVIVVEIPINIAGYIHIG